MSDTTFVSGTTIASEWLNDVNDFVYTNIGSDSDGAKGAGLVGYGHTLTYPADTLGKKLKQYLHVEDCGAVGDGVTNDYAAIAEGIAESIARGIELHFDGSKTYYVSVSSWTIGAGARLHTNGCTFVCPNTTTGDTVWLTVSGVIDTLNVSVPTGIRRDRCILITGDDSQVGSLKLTSVDQQANTGAADGGIQIASGARIYIGYMLVTNYDRPFIVHTTSSSTIGRVEATSYTRGLYLYNNVNLRIDSGRVTTASPNAVGSAGSNGILMGCTGTDLQRNVSIYNFIVEDATEHAFRVSGPEQQSNIRFQNCAAYNAGGVGMKVLGTDAGIPTSRNKNIIIDNFIAEDVGTNGSLAAPNRAGLLIKFCEGVQITSPIVRKRNQTYSSQYCCVIDGAASVNITSPIFNDAQYDGLLGWASDGDITYLYVNGGTMRANGQYGVHLVTDAAKTMTRPVIDGVSLVNNTGNAFSVNNGGTLSSGYLRTMSTGNAGAGQCDSTSIKLNITASAAEIAATALSGISGRNGSMADDAVTLNILKAGTWTAL